MNSAVYYPYIHPTASWLKVAALCWDEVFHLVPGAAPPPPQELEDLNAALGGVLHAREFTVASRDGDERFRAWIERRAPLRGHSKDEEWMAMFSAKLPPDGALLDLLDERGLIRTPVRHLELPSWEAETWGAEMPQMEPSSGPGRRYKKLLEEASAHRTAGDRQRAEDLKKRAQRIWDDNLVTVESRSDIEMRRDVALHYLSLCASEAAEIYESDLAADGEAFTDVVFHGRRGLQGDVARSVLEAYLPADPEALDVARITELRSELGAARLRYQAEIAGLVDRFSALSSESDLHKIKDEVVEIATQRVESTRRAYGRAKLDLGAKALAISVTPPAVGPWLASALGLGIFAPISLAAGLLLVGAKLLTDLRAAREEREHSPWSYVLESSALLRA